METDERLLTRQQFDKKEEWKKLNSIMAEGQVISERISDLQQEIVSLRRKLDKNREVYHTELCLVRPSVIGPAPGEREKLRKSETQSDILAKKLKTAIGSDADKLAKLAELLNL